MIGLQHVPYKATLQQLRLFSIAHRRIRGGLIPMFKITFCLLKFSMEYIFTPPTRKGLLGDVYNYTCRCQHAFGVRTTPFRNNLPAEVVDAPSVNSFWMPTGCPVPRSTVITHLLPQPTPSAHMTQLRNSHPHDPFHIPSRLVVYSSPYC